MTGAGGGLLAVKGASRLLGVETSGSRGFTPIGSLDMPAEPHQLPSFVIIHRKRPIFGAFSAPVSSHKTLYLLPFLAFLALFQAGGHVQIKPNMIGYKSEHE